jgi:hypothetical protein
VFSTQPVHYTQRALSKPVISPAHLWFERLGITLITLFALGTPLLFGLGFYLSVNEEGIAINASNPLAETRLWMTREKRGITGLALQTTSPAQPQAPSANAQCATTRVFILRWVDGLSTDQSARYCKCYALANGNFSESPATCKP